MSNQSKKTPLELALVKPGQRFSKIRAVKELTFAQEKLYVMSMMRRDKNLRSATPDSIADAVLQAASMGLSLNPIRGHCYLICRKARRRRQGESQSEYDKVPTFAYASPSYRGLINIPVTSGAIRFARAEVLYKDDHFIYRGPHHDVEYQLKTDHSAQLEKHAVGVFAVARTIHGDYLSEYVPRETIQKIRAMSEIPGAVMWHPDKLWTEGWKKAALRRLYKTLPNAPMALDVAIDSLNRHEGMDPANLKRQETTGEAPPEAVVIISGDQLNELHATLTDAGKSSLTADRWLLRLAKTYGLDNIKNLPTADFSEALDKITMGLKP